MCVLFPDEQAHTLATEVSGCPGSGNRRRHLACGLARNFVIFTELECHHAGPVGVVFLELRDLAVPEQSMAPWQMLIVSLRLAIDHIARIQQLSLKSSLVGVEVKTEKEASRRTCSVLDWGIGVVEHADDNGIF